MRPYRASPEQLFDLGEFQKNSGLYNDALTTYEIFLSRFSEITYDFSNELLSIVLFNIADIKESIGQSNISIEFFEQLIDINSNVTFNDNSLIYSIVTVAHFRKAILLSNNHQHDDAYNIFLHVADATKPYWDERSREIHYNSLYHIGIQLRDLERIEMAIKSFNYLIRSLQPIVYSHDFDKLKTDAFLFELYVMSYSQKGSLFARLNQFSDAISAHTFVSSLINKSKDEFAIEFFARSMLDRASLYAATGYFYEAISDHQAIIARSHYAEVPFSVRHAAVSYYHIGNIFRNRSDFQKSVNAFDEVIKFYTDDCDTLVLEYVVKALNDKSLSLLQLNEKESAFSGLHFIIERFSNHDHQAIRLVVITACLYLGHLYEQDGNLDQAILVYDKALDCFKNETNLEIRRCWVMLLSDKANLFRNSGNFTLSNEVINKAMDAEKNSFDIKIHGIIVHLLFMRGLNSIMEDRYNKYIDSIIDIAAFLARPILDENVYAEKIFGLIYKYMNTRQTHNDEESLIDRLLELRGVPSGIRQDLGSAIKDLIKQVGSNITAKIGNTVFVPSRLKERREFLDKYYQNRESWIEVRGKDPTPADLLAWADRAFPDRQKLGLVFSDLKNLDKTAYDKIRNWVRSKPDGAASDFRLEDFGFPSKVEQHDPATLLASAPTGAEVFEAIRRGDPDAASMVRLSAAARYYRRKKRSQEPSS